MAIEPALLQTFLVHSTAKVLLFADCANFFRVLSIFLFNFRKSIIERKDAEYESI